MEMDLDTWLTYYYSLPGYRVTVEDDGSYSAWMVYDAAGELVDWWWLKNADKRRAFGKDGKPAPPDSEISL